jgi:hypothetical protein
MALWGGRFSQAADQRFKELNDSLRFDYRLAEQDIVGSVAWSKALVTVNVLTADEQQQLEGALNVLLEEVRANPRAILERSLSTRSVTSARSCTLAVAVTIRSRPTSSCGVKRRLSSFSWPLSSCSRRWLKPPKQIRMP